MWRLGRDGTERYEKESSLPLYCGPNVRRHWRLDASDDAVYAGAASDGIGLMAGGYVGCLQPADTALFLVRWCSAEQMAREDDAAMDTGASGGHYDGICAAARSGSNGARPAHDAGATIRNPLHGRSSRKAVDADPAVRE
ncbi:hypothetical protein D3C78_1430730 [compost metagenome]